MKAENGRERVKGAVERWGKAYQAKYPKAAWIPPLARLARCSTSALYGCINGTRQNWTPSETFVRRIESTVETAVKTGRLPRPSKRGGSRPKAQSAPQKRKAAAGAKRAGAKRPAPGAISPSDELALMEMLRDLPADVRARVIAWAERL